MEQNSTNKRDGVVSFHPSKSFIVFLCDALLVVWIFLGCKESFYRTPACYILMLYIRVSALKKAAVLCLFIL